MSQNRVSAVLTKQGIVGVSATDNSHKVSEPDWGKVFRELIEATDEITATKERVGKDGRVLAIPATSTNVEVVEEAVSEPSEAELQKKGSVDLSFGYVGLDTGRDR